MKRKNSRHADMMTSAIKRARDKEAGLRDNAADREKARADAAEARIIEIKAMLGLARESCEFMERCLNFEISRSNGLEAQCAAMREEMEHLVSAADACDREAENHPSSRSSAPMVRYTNALATIRSRLSGDAGRALLERGEALERDLAEKSERCSRGAHALIEIIGAPGPEHIDETCARASRRIVALERVADAARKYVDSDDEDRASEFDAMSSALDAMEAKR